MTSNHHALYVLGYTRTTMAVRLHEVGIASNGRSAYCREYVPGPCTHRPSHHESWKYPKPVS